VTVLIEEHTCTSSARRKTTIPTSAWVASKVVHLFKKELNMGLRELRKRLEEKYKCEIYCGVHGCKMGDSGTGARLEERPR
jgi:hypothetical protein